MIAPPEEVFAFLKRLHVECQSFVLRLKFDKQHAPSRTAIALYGSIMELCSGLICLVEQQLLPGAPVLLRAVLEAHVDLVNILANPRYGYSLERSYIREWKKLLQEAQSGSNEYLDAISKQGSLVGRIQELQRKDSKLEAQGHRVLLLEQKFRLAGMEKEYRSLYNSLCCASHNNIRSLVDRHFEFSDEDFTVVFYKAYTPEDASVYVGTATEVLLRATEALHAKLESEDTGSISALRAEFNGLRGDA